VGDQPVLDASGNADIGAEAAEAVDADAGV